MECLKTPLPLQKADSKSRGVMGRGGGLLQADRHGLSCYLLGQSAVCCGGMHGTVVPAQQRNISSHNSCPTSTVRTTTGGRVETRQG
jgi:hypothetical protein